jgi:Mg-chelatase subunit ChlD
MFEAALADIEVGEGSRLDLGLAQAAELRALPGRSSAARAVIVITDGRASPPGPEAAVAQAERLRAQGARVYAVGLGQGVDVVTLQRIASNGLFYWVEDAPALDTASEDLAALTVCAN